MTQAKLKAALDTALKLTTSRAGGAPGIVAMATDKTSNFYEGASGTRELERTREGGRCQRTHFEWGFSRVSAMHAHDGAARAALAKHPRRTALGRPRGNSTLDHRAMGRR
jgi:hypothetical protein